MMKVYGGVLLFFGAFQAFASPWFILIAVLGLLFFLQGMENSMAALILDSIRDDKGPDELGDDNTD